MENNSTATIPVPTNTSVATLLLTPQVQVSTSTTTTTTTELPVPLPPSASISATPPFETPKGIILRAVVGYGQGPLGPNNSVTIQKSDSILKLLCNGPTSRYWYAAGYNEPLDSEMPLRSKISNYLCLPSLMIALIIKDGNQGGDYFRFLGYFENDPNRYFHIFSLWDLQTPFFELKEGQFFQVENRIWKVRAKDMHDFAVELVPL